MNILFGHKITSPSFRGAYLQENIFIDLFSLPLLQDAVVSDFILKHGLLLRAAQ